MDNHERLTKARRLLGQALNGVGDVCSPTGKLALIAAWVMFLISALLLIITIPICFAGPQLREVAVKSDSAAVKAVAEWMMSPATAWLRIDESAATIICFAMFFGVVVRLIDYCRRFDVLHALLCELRSHPTGDGIRHCSKEPELKPLLDEFCTGPGPTDMTECVDRFHRRLIQQTRIRQHEDYLVAMGLLGTMLAFYFGFAQRLTQGLSYSALDETARELLTVVGTAAISTVVGVALGMLAVPPMSSHLANRRSELLDLARETIRKLGKPDHSAHQETH